METRLNIIHILVFTYLFLLISVPIARAQSAQIDIGHIQLKSKNNPTSPTPTVPLPTKEQGPIFYKSSVLEKYTTGMINLNLSLPFLYFSALAPTRAQLRKNTLSVNVVGDSSESFYLYADTDLTNQNNKQLIPPTSCDNGNCSPTNSEQWSNTLTYGLGYNCSGGLAACYSSFSDSSMFRPLSTNLSQAVTLDDGLINSVQTYKFLYKVNVSASQAGGSYITNVNYLFLPNL